MLYSLTVMTLWGIYENKINPSIRTNFLEYEIHVHKTF
jgi:hypothetical protein